MGQPKLDHAARANARANAIVVACTGDENGDDFFLANMHDNNEIAESDSEDDELNLTALRQKIARSQAGARVISDSEADDSEDDNLELPALLQKINSLGAQMQIPADADVIA